MIENIEEYFVVLYMPLNGQYIIDIIRNYNFVTLYVTQNLSACLLNTAHV